MRILITGASGNIGTGLIPLLQDAGHELVLTDLHRPPSSEPIGNILFVQGDIQQGIRLDLAAQGCDLIVHLPAWHGIHWAEKTEADYWRLNVDGTFWMFQAAQAANIKRVVFLSSTSWYGHYEKYGFTKRIGEELCEYNRQRHGIRYIAVRPNDLTPWGSDYLRYGARLLYGGVDREDVLQCIVAAEQALEPPLADDAESEGFSVDAKRVDSYIEEQLEGWAEDPVATCERIFPGSQALIAKYKLDIKRKPTANTSSPSADRMGYRPQRHFGTFIEDLRKLDSLGGEDAVRSVKCPY